MLKRLVIGNEVLKQFKELTVNEEKLFYYTLGKLQSRVLGVKLKSDNIYPGSLTDSLDFTGEPQIFISYDEIKSLFNANRNGKNKFEALERQYINLYDEFSGMDRMVSLHERIIFNRKHRRIEVLFTESAAKLLTVIDDKVSKDEEGKCLGGFTTISINNICPLKKSYDLKFYLYALTILRGNKGCVTMGMDGLRNILGQGAKIEDKMFYQRYIKNPSKAINDLNLDIKVYTDRKGENVVIKVIKRKGI